MSLHLPQSKTRRLPIQSVSIPWEAYQLTTDLYHDTGIQWQLLKRIQEQEILPLVSPSGYLEGILTSFSLLSHNVLLNEPHDGASLSAMVPAHCLQIPLLLQEARMCLISLQSEQTVLDAQAVLCKTQYPVVPVVDADGRYTGYVASREKLLGLLSEQPVLPRIGGMATPLGVYLTTGKLQAGAGWQGLILLGACFGAIMAGIEWSYPVFNSLVYACFPRIFNLPTPYNTLASIILEFSYILGCLLCMVRWTPLSGLHAAEHMTVNTIESGVPLTVENIARQPRIHKRCGTNLAVPLVLAQVAYFSLDAIYSHISLLGTVLYIGLAWTVIWYSRKPMGIWMQSNWTTKPPTAKQIMSGLSAGKELMSVYQANPHPPAKWYERFVGSGLLYVIIGSSVAYFIANWVIESLLRWHWF